MKGSLEILKAGLMTSIQDLGRKGMAYYAIPLSGAMDVNAAKIALLLIHQPESNPLIECTSLAPSIRFLSDTKIAISGADFNWKLNGLSVSPNIALEIKSGDELIGSFAKNGLRGYIAIQGDLDMEPVLGSRSTYTRASLGGHEGRLLRKGDLLYWRKKGAPSNAFELRKGPEYDYLPTAVKEKLVGHKFTISSDTDRMGMRLEGPELRIERRLTDSVPVLPGFMQLPPSGHPIIVLQDGQTTGGYPRIAYLAMNDLARLNQLPLGSELFFTLQH